MVIESYSSIGRGGLDLAGVDCCGLNSTDVLGILGKTNHCYGLNKSVLWDIVGDILGVLNNEIVDVVVCDDQLLTIRLLKQII